MNLYDNYVRTPMQIAFDAVHGPDARGAFSLADCVLRPTRRGLTGRFFRSARRMAIRPIDAALIA